MSSLHAPFNTLACIILLAALTTTVLWVYGVPQRWAPVWAVARGLFQLSVLSVVLSGVITHGWLVSLGIGAMFGVAVVTAARRLTASGRRLLPAIGTVALGMGAGVGAVLLIVFGTGALELTARYALALAGIVIGNAMTTSALTGRRLTEAIVDRWSEVEGWLALGATPRQATASMARQAVHHAMIPATDQAKTTGVVTLPGAFVGAIFGGLSPLEAGRFQIIVLGAILAAGAVCSIVIAHVMSPVTTKPLPVD
ncbi:ABC transporter permease [Gordonia hydrophobica]|uniref:ABC transporter permease n=1 Tax=Gordonia hydrophobica TaxID=40516 RepID=A0ABZ2U1U9_9ACTN|nr:ABC transporter permease [Gordonia hydrophobica]MBM7366746.1 putative ABC transport system permease protein [Gordonia hydrophobica]